MNRETDRDYLALSGIQHYAYCPRQWALIHIEQQWQENILTFKGRQFHEKTNQPFITEKRKNRIMARAVPIISHILGLYGIADVVEFQKVESGVTIDARPGQWWPTPIEYKVGRPKLDSWDRLQLCAQAICLEEMFGLSLATGYLYYGKPRRRLEVNLNAKLRKETKQTAEQMHHTFAIGITPKAKHTAFCQNCSLARLCLPILSEKGKVDNYLSCALDINC